MQQNNQLIADLEYELVSNMNANEQVTQKIADMEAKYDKTNQENAEYQIEITKLEQNVRDIEH